MPGPSSCPDRRCTCILGYIGKSDVFYEAITNFAIVYAEQMESDHRALKEAVKSARIDAKKGL
jgi:hypothetical protein